MIFDIPMPLLREDQKHDIVLPVKAWFPLYSKCHDHGTKRKRLKVQRSPFTVIALFLLEIGRCRGRDWLDRNQA